MSERLIEEARSAKIGETDFVVLVPRLAEALEEAERSMRQARDALEPRWGYWSDEEVDASAILDEALRYPDSGETEEGKS
jgi:hypothetical protein